MHLRDKKINIKLILKKAKGEVLLNKCFVRHNLKEMIGYPLN